jgi:2-octaprenyl-6-methoxyphenol hydroxylase
MSKGATRWSDYDVVIAGGGLVGGSLALALSGSDLRVALIEAVPHDSAAQPSFDDRTIALSHGSCTVLRQLGLWAAIADDVFPIHKIHVSEQGRFGNALIDAAEQGIGELGHVIRGRELGRALWGRIEGLSALDIFCPARVSATTLADDGSGMRIATVSGDDGEQLLRTRLLVVADGARSALREALGVGSSTHAYGQTAIVANVQVDPRRAGHTAYERFTPAGPLAVLPGQAGRYTVVLARDDSVADDCMQMSDAAFLQLLQQSIGFRLGRLEKLGRRFSYPLSLVQTAALTAERAVVIGNAAHGLHPVAGQGFNLGLRDAASLAELLVAGCRAADDAYDPGTDQVLQAYAAWRHDDQKNVVAFTDGLIRLFGRSGGLLATGRGLGLALFDMVPVAKRALARRTMGLSGRMTRLARGLDL